MTRAAVCLPCDELEHDGCHNLLWAADCTCPHTSWPEPQCGVLGREGGSNRLWICDQPTLHTDTHEGRYWFDPDPAEETVRWWGWARRPQRWTRKRVVPRPGRLDPYDPTAPCAGDLVRSAA
jgi:hypothetical protein